MLSFCYGTVCALWLHITTSNSQSSKIDCNLKVQHNNQTVTRPQKQDLGLVEGSATEIDMYTRYFIPVGLWDNVPQIVGGPWDPAVAIYSQQNSKFGLPAVHMGI